MFEILKALMALEQAAAEHGTHLSWNVQDTTDDVDWTPVLKAQIQITKDDLTFVQQMQELLGERAERS